MNLASSAYLLIIILPIWSCSNSMELEDGGRQHNADSVAPSAQDARSNVTPATTPAEDTTVASNNQPVEEQTSIPPKIDEQDTSDEIDEPIMSGGAFLSCIIDKERTDDIQTVLACETNIEDFQQDQIELYSGSAKDNLEKVDPSEVEISMITDFSWLVFIPNTILESIIKVTLQSEAIDLVANHLSPPPPVDDNEQPEIQSNSNNDAEERASNDVKEIAINQEEEPKPLFELREAIKGTIQIGDGTSRLSSGGCNANVVKNFTIVGISKAYPFAVPEGSTSFSVTLKNLCGIVRGNEATLALMKGDKVLATKYLPTGFHGKLDFKFNVKDAGEYKIRLKASTKRIRGRWDTDDFFLTDIIIE